jgi:kynurenine formamidase
VAHFSPHGISIDDVKVVAAEQGATFRTGDVLVLRTGYVKAYQASSEERKQEIAGVREWCGLAQGRETTQWLWERQFAALVSDSPDFNVRRKCTISPNTNDKLTESTSPNRSSVASASHPAGWLGHAHWRVV